MPCFLAIGTTLSDVVQLLFMLIAFVVVIIAACYTTKFLVKIGYIQGKTSNIEVKESFRIAPNKSVQILKIGNKYVAVAIGKEEVTLLTELAEEELEFPEVPQMPAGNPMVFTDMFRDILKNQKEDKKDKEKSEKE